MDDPFPAIAASGRRGSPGPGVPLAVSIILAFLAPGMRSPAIKGFVHPGNRRAPFPQRVVAAIRGFGLGTQG